MLPEGLSFASRFDHVSCSAIREIFKVLTRPNMISFAGGSPSAEALPDGECAELARQVLLDDGKISGAGTHDQLMASNHIYQEVYKSQQEGATING